MKIIKPGNKWIGAGIWMDFMEDDYGMPSSMLLKACSTSTRQRKYECTSKNNVFLRMIAMRVVVKKCNAVPRGDVLFMSTIKFNCEIFHSASHMLDKRR